MTYTVLQIESSPVGDRSVTRKFTTKVIAGLKEKHPDAKIILRDLAVNPVNHISGAEIGATYTPADQRTPEQRATLQTVEDLLGELVSADVIVIGAPMHNFSVTSTLKAWIDHIVVPGRTYQYGEGGIPHGLLAADKKVIVVSASGGVYSEPPMIAFDFLKGYLRHVMGFIGLTDVSFISAEGVSRAPDIAAKGMATAEGQLIDVLKKVA